VAPEFERRMAELAGLRDVSSDLELITHSSGRHPPRSGRRARRYGTAGTECSRGCYGGQQISTIYGDVSQYWLLLQLAPRYQTDSERRLSAL